MAVDLRRPVERIVRCPRCTAHHGESEPHHCSRWEIPPALAWLNPAALSQRQLTGIDCVRCGGYLGAPGVRCRQLGEATDPHGHRLTLYDHGANACPNPPPPHGR